MKFKICFLTVVHLDKEISALPRLLDQVILVKVSWIFYTFNHSKWLLKSKAVFHVNFLQHVSHEQLFQIFLLCFNSWNTTSIARS